MKYLLFAVALVSCSHFAKSEKTLCGEWPFSLPPDGSQFGNRTLTECRINLTVGAQFCLYVPEDKQICVMAVDVPSEQQWHIQYFGCATGEALSPPVEL